MDNWVEGDRVKVKLAGDEDLYTGTMLDRSRKLWVELDKKAEYPEFLRGFIADENNIEKIEKD